jgi:hypothetical protein
MRWLRQFCAGMLLLASVALLGSSFAQSQDQGKSADLSKAKDTVDRIRQPDPPQVSTTTKKSRYN